MAAAVETPKKTSTKGKTGFDKKTQKIDAVSRPDKDEFMRKTAEFKKEKDLRFEELKTINDKIRETTRGKGEFERKKDDVKNALDSIRDEIQILEDKKAKIVDELNLRNEKNRSKRTEILKMRENIKFTSIEEIEKKITELEDTMITSTFSIKEEKIILGEIRQLQKMKPLLKECTVAETQAKELESNKLNPSGQLKELNEALATLRDRRKCHQEKHKSLMDNRNTTLGPVKDLYNRKKELQDELDTIKKQMEAVHSQFEAGDAQYRDYQQKLLKAKADFENQERKANEHIEKRSRLEAELQDLQLSSECSHYMVMLQHTILYVQKLVDDFEGPKTPVANDSPSSGATAAQSLVDDDYAGVLVSKKMRDDDVYFAAKNKKSTKKKGGKAKKAGLISHEIRVFADFEELGVDPPLNYSDAPACLERLENKLTVIKQEQMQLIENKQDRIENVKHKLESLEKAEKEKADCTNIGSENEKANCTNIGETPSPLSPSATE